MASRTTHKNSSRRTVVTEQAGFNCKIRSVLEATICLLPQAFTETFLIAYTAAFIRSAVGLFLASPNGQNRLHRSSAAPAWRVYITRRKQGIPISLVVSDGRYHSQTFALGHKFAVYWAPYAPIRTSVFGLVQGSDVYFKSHL